MTGCFCTNGKGSDVRVDMVSLAERRGRSNPSDAEREKEPSREEREQEIEKEKVCLCHMLVKCQCLHGYCSNWKLRLVRSRSINSSTGSGGSKRSGVSTNIQTSEFSRRQITFE